MKFYNDRGNILICLLLVSLEAIFKFFFLNYLLFIIFLFLKYTFERTVKATREQKVPSVKLNRIL